MSTLRIERERASLNRDNQQEHPIRNLAKAGKLLKLNENYSNLVSEDFDGKMTKMISQEISRNRSKRLGVLSKFGDLLLNTQVLTQWENLQEFAQGTGRQNIKVNKTVRSKILIQQLTYTKYVSPHGET